MTSNRGDRSQTDTKAAHSEHDLEPGQCATDHHIADTSSAFHHCTASQPPDITSQHITQTHIHQTNAVEIHNVHCSSLFDFTDNFHE